MSEYRRGEASRRVVFCAGDSAKVKDRGRTDAWLSVILASSWAVLGSGCGDICASLLLSVLAGLVGDSGTARAGDAFSPVSSVFRVVSRLSTPCETDFTEVRFLSSSLFLTAANLLIY